MKKIKLLAPLVMCLSFSAQAQTTTAVPSTTAVPGAKVIHGPYYTNITDVNGNSNTVVSVTPGIAVQTPWWINNIGNVAKSAMGGSGNNQQAAVNTQQGSINNQPAAVNTQQENVDNGGTVVIKSQAPSIKETNARIEKELGKQVQPPKPSMPEVNAAPVETVAPQRSGQTITPVRIDNNMANFNQSTLREMEDVGKKQTNEAYLEFLRK